MPNSRQTPVIASPSRSRATKRRRSSMTELAFHGIHTLPQNKSGKCNPCVRYVLSPVSRAAHYPNKLSVVRTCGSSAVFGTFLPRKLHVTSPAGRFPSVRPVFLQKSVLASERTEFVLVQNKQFHGAA